MSGSGSAGGTGGNPPVGGKMSFVPGWARQGSTTGLVRSSNLSSGTGISKPPGKSAQSDQDAHQGNVPALEQKQTAMQQQQALLQQQALALQQQVLQMQAAGVPTPVNSVFANLNISGRSAAAALAGGERRKPSAAPTADPTASLAPLGRVSTNASRSGKLTERANQYQQQQTTAVPQFPAHGSGVLQQQQQSIRGGVKIRYSLEELVALNEVTNSSIPNSPMPNFPTHVNPGLITDRPQNPLSYSSTNEIFERESLLAEWQTEQEKRNANPRSGIGGGLSSGLGDRRQGGQGQARGLGGRQDPSSGRMGGSQSGNNWRNGASSGDQRSGHGNNKESRWNNNVSSSSGGRWGFGDSQGNQNQRNSGGGNSRWDSLRSGGRNDSRGGIGQSGDPTRDAQNAARWRRPGSHSDDMSYDDRGTFGDAIMTTGGLGLDAMAAAAEKFAHDMEASHSRGAVAAAPTDGIATVDPGQSSTLDHNQLAMLSGLMSGSGDDGLLGALEDNVDAPPEKTVGGVKETTTTAPPKSGWGSAAPQQQPEQVGGGGWGSAAPQTSQSVGGWVVPPAGPSGSQQQQPHQQQQPPMPPIMSQVRLSDEWLYQDPQGNMQGPFKTEEMRGWLEAGYFSTDLLVRRGGENGPFTPLGHRFPRGNAFTKEADQELLMMQRQQPQQPGGIPYWNQPQGRGMFNNQMQQQQQEAARIAQLRKEGEQLRLLEQQRLQQQAKEEQRRRQQLEEAERQRQLFEEQREAAKQQQREAAEQLQREAAEQLQRRAVAQVQAEQQRLAMKQKQAAQRQQEEERECKLQLAAAEEQARRKAAEKEAKRKARLEAQAAAEAEAARKAVEEKPAWGGVAKAETAAADKPTLTLKQIQEMEQREAQKRPQAGPGGSLSLAARIAQAGTAADYSGPSTGSPALAHGNTKPAVPGPAQAVQLPSAADEEPRIAVNAQGKVLNEMSVDLHAVLGAGASCPGNGGNKQQRAKAAHSASHNADKPVWGSTASSAGNAKIAANATHGGKSLKHIQEEEAARLRARQQQQKAQGVATASGGRWAAKAGSQPSWDLGSGAMPTPAMATTQKQQKKQQPKQHQPHQSGLSSEELSMMKQFSDNNSSAADNFGGQTMSDDMRRWCESQVQKLGATMTLIDFCYTLADASDIREYLRDYLGSTPQVSAFASEFIQRKQGKTSGFDDSSADASGFQPASSKKGKKGKKDAK